MKRLMNFLRGRVLLTATGLFPERLLNLCAQEGVTFWEVSWPDEHTVCLTTRRYSLARLEELARRAGCELRVEGELGLPAFLLRFRKRYAFLVGLGLSLCAVAFLSQFILTIQVSGNERVPTAVILSQLRRSGVRVGVYGPGLDRKQIAQEALLELDDLAWMGINLHGTRLEVIVRETIEPPERVDEDDFFDIVAETDGVILRIEPELGDEMVAKNSVVAAGDILISGTVTMEPPIYSDLPARYYQVHARGRVWAKTWRTLTAAIPLEAEVKAYTGAEQNRWFVEILGRSIEIFGNSSFSGGKYDKITTVWQARLPNGTPLPLTLRRERQRAYETAQRTVDETAAREMLETRLSDRLTALLGDTGQAEETGFSAAAENGLLKVTLTAQCQEEIGKEVPGTTPLSAQ